MDLESFGQRKKIKQVFFRGNCVTPGAKERTSTANITQGQFDLSFMLSHVPELHS